MYPLSTCILKPEGRICSSYDTEIGGISSTFDHILSNRNKYLNAKILIGSDSQSTLTIMKQSPNRKFHYLGIDTLLLWKKLLEISIFIKNITLYYTPSHANIIGNELADKYAK